VQIANAAMDPSTIGQGIIVKIIIVLALARAVNSAVAYRKLAGQPR
jgi:hypothetical protein